MIEVEVRGELTAEQHQSLQEFLKEKGKFIRRQDREMVLLRDHPGYSQDFVGREVDIRLRNTNGNCEIMLKEKVSDKARKEISLKLQDKDLENAKVVMKALGCNKGNWMHRISEIYEYGGAEWAVVEAVPGIYYYEIEREAGGETEVDLIHNELISLAQAQGLNVFSDEQTREFIEQLDTKVNKIIDL